MQRAAAKADSGASTLRRWQAGRRVVIVLVLLACALLAARTFLVQGVFVPVRVEGGSMAPALLGAHWDVVCLGCGGATILGAEATEIDREIPCPRCETPLPRSGGRLIPGDRVLLDRFTYRTRGPRRFELVAFRSPEGRGELAVKRVLGLPEEEVAIREGDLWIDGRRLQKTPAEFRAQAVLVRELEPLPADAAGVTRFTLGVGKSGQSRGPITDELPYNGALSHRMSPVADLAIEATVARSSSGTVELRLPGPQPWRAVLDFSTGKAQLYLGELPVDLAPCPAGAGEVQLWFGHWDGQCELWAGEQRILAAPQPAAGLPRGELLGSPELLVTGPGVQVGSARLWRDLYLTAAPDRHGIATGPWQLGPDESFVAGDNQAVSEDSRTWRRPGLPRSAIVGRPVRW